MGRLIGLILVLLIVGLTISRFAGQPEDGGVIPQGHQDALDKANALESQLQSTTEIRLQEREVD